MAEFLLGFAYEPEYTPEELEARSKGAASVCSDATSAGLDWCQCECCRPVPTSSECMCCHTSEL